MKLSQTDQHLLTLLRENARTSTAQLARKLGESAGTNSVTMRDRDTGKQERMAIDKVGAFVAEKLGV